MTSPALTLVVPTKNRQHTAVTTVGEAAKLADARELEIVVHDCSDDARLRAMLAEAGLLDRVVYHHIDRAVSMTENWNLAVAYATGEWVMVIGDDDALAPAALDAARWATPRDLGAVKGKRYSFYGHPDLPEPEVAARLHVPPFTGEVSVQETRPVLEPACRAGNGYPNLPMAYHNLIRRSLLERIRAKAGHYFDGLAPDIYSAFAIGGLLDRFAVVDYPLSIVGASARSNTNRARAGEDHLHVQEYPDHRYSWMTPDSHILAASVPDNIVRAMTDVGRHDLLERVDVPHIYARTIHAEPRRAREHLRKYVAVRRRQGRGVVSGVAILTASVAGKFLIGVVRRFRPKPPPPGEWFEGIATLGAALAKQDEWLRAHGIVPRFESVA